LIGTNFMGGAQHASAFFAGAPDVPPRRASWYPSGAERNQRRNLPLTGGGRRRADMRMKTSLLAAALLAGISSYALAQGAGTGTGGTGAGSDISAPKLNAGPGGTAPQTGPLKTKKVHFKKKKTKRHM